MMENHKEKIEDFERKVLTDYNELTDDLNDPIFLIHTIYDETMMSIKD